MGYIGHIWVKEIKNTQNVQQNTFYSIFFFFFFCIWVIQRFSRQSCSFPPYSSLPPPPPKHTCPSHQHLDTEVHLHSKSSSSLAGATITVQQERKEVSDLQEVEFHLGGVVQCTQHRAVADAGLQELHTQVLQAVHVELHTDTEHM